MGPGWEQFFAAVGFMATIFSFARLFEWFEQVGMVKLGQWMVSHGRNRGSHRTKRTR